MFRRSSVSFLIGLVFLGQLMAPAPTAASEPTLSADMGGHAIPAIQVGQYYCHDFDYPRIHCFPTDARLEQAVAAYGAGPLATPGSASVAYVRVFQDASFSGNSMYISADYPDLDSIGWNDKISSFYGLNNLAGAFYQNAYYTGLVYSFCCNTQVTYVGNVYNDMFSSVQHTP